MSKAIRIIQKNTIEKEGIVVKVGADIAHTDMTKKQIILNNF